jgi:hypothetical protein
VCLFFTLCARTISVSTTLWIVYRLTGHQIYSLVSGSRRHRHLDRERTTMTPPALLSISFALVVLLSSLPQQARAQSCQSTLSALPALHDAGLTWAAGGQSATFGSNHVQLTTFGSCGYAVIVPSSLSLGGLEIAHPSSSSPRKQATRLHRPIRRPPKQRARRSLPLMAHCRSLSKRASTSSASSMPAAPALHRHWSRGFSGQAARRWRQSRASAFCKR